MPAKGTRKRLPFAHLVKTHLTHEQAAALAVQAKSCQMTQARYVRDLIASELESTHRPKPSPSAVLNRDALAHEINAFGLQVRKLGVNVNQLAKQANTAMVPLCPAEVIYLQNQLQLLVSESRAALERVLA